MAAAVVGLVPAVAAAAQPGGFATDYENHQVDAFTFGSGMTLTPGGSAGAGVDTWGEAATPNGRYLYAVNYSDGTVSQYSIGSTGSLAQLSPATVESDTSLGSGAGSLYVAVSPDGRNAYVANYGGSVSVFDIGSDGTLTPVQRVTTGLVDPMSVAISPDGSSAYVADAAGTIAEFNRASNGTLAAKSTPSIPTADRWGTLAITPSGKYLYENDYYTSRIDEFSVGSGGELTPLSVPSAPTGADTYVVIVSPNGENAYSSSCDDDGVYQYSIGSDGELAQLSPASVPTDGCGLPWMTANGGSFYIPDDGTDIYQFNVSTSGALTPKSPETVTYPGATDLWGFVIPPDQGPVARFSDKVKGKKAEFDAATSSDSDGTVASYQWNFGDGHSLTTTRAKVSHTYAKNGRHRVTLTVTDDSGCSLTQVFTGQTAYCNGTPAARTTHTVKVAALRSLTLKVSPSRAKASERTCYAFSATSDGHGVRRVSVTLAGRTAHTAGTGKATLCLTLKKGTYTARARRTGYHTAAARVRVSAAAPVFTG